MHLSIGPFYHFAQAKQESKEHFNLLFNHILSINQSNEYNRMFIKFR
jgi:hypothetical protein